MKQRQVKLIKRSAIVLVLSSLFSVSAFAETVNLKTSIQRALNQNPNLEVSQAQLKQAKLALSQAELSRLPQVNLSLTASNSNNALSAFGMKLQQQGVVASDFAPSALNNPDGYTDFNTRVEMLLPVWNGGKISASQDQASEMIQAALYSDRAMQQFLTYSVYQAYESVHAARAHIKVAEQAKRTADAFVKTTQNLVNEGVVVRSELLSAKVHQSMADAALLKAEGQEQIALDTLKVLMNESRYADIDVGERLDLKLPIDTEADLIEMALGANPVLEAKRKEALSSQFATKVAKAGHYPSFNVMMRQDWNDDSVALNNGSYTVAGVVSWKVTDFGVTQSSVDMANAYAQQKKSSVKAEENRVRLEVQTFWHKLVVAQKEVQADILAVQHATEAQALIVKRYEGGVSTITEVLTSQTRLDEAKAELVSAKFDVNIYKAKLRLATGTMDMNQL